MPAGRVVYLYAFDVANEIRTSEIRLVLSEKPFPFEIRVGQTVPKDVPLYKPLTIALRPEETATSVGRVTVKPFVKLFDVGVLSISFEVAFRVERIADLVAYHELKVRDLPLHEEATRLCAQVTDNLRAFLVKPNVDRGPAEAYTVFCVEGVEGPAGAWAEEHRHEIAALLSEDSGPGKLSTEQVAETLRHRLSYFEGDLVIPDWDAAVVVDREGYFDDVLYVIELANVQLEEFKLLDDRLDVQFQQAVDRIERYYARPRLFGSPQGILRRLRSIRMDIAKMSEEVTNITKFVGDWYLARVYLALKDRFHLGQWEASVDAKLKQLDDAYSLVQAEMNNRRMIVLEAMIVALFVIDIAALFFFTKPA